jgi:hypothetical protein
MTSAISIIRNCRLVDVRRRLAEPADILVEGDTILSIGPTDWRRRPTPYLSTPPTAR